MGMFFIFSSLEPEVVGAGFRSLRNLTQGLMFHVEHRAAFLTGCGQTIRHPNYN